MATLVSIICGVYQAKSNIKRLINSLLAQTYENIEIVLCVNGEDDGSLDIIKDFAEKDSRIRWIYSDAKLGAGGARERAFLESRGEYIAVVDCDDYVKPTYISNLICFSLDENSPDVIISGFEKWESNKKLYERKYENTSKALIQSVAPWGKLYRREFFVKNDIHFQNIPFGEDVLFTAEIILCNPIVRIIQETDYIWINRKNSLSHTEIRLLPVGTVDFAEHFFLKMKGKSYDENKMLYLAYKYFIWYLLQSGRKTGSKRITNEYKKTIEIMQKFADNWEMQCFKQILEWKDDRFVVRMALISFLCFRFLRVDYFFIGLYGSLPLGDYFWPKL